MDIKTKLSIGDKIFPIWLNGAEEKVECKVCKGTRKVKLNDNEYNCPECHSEGFKIEWKPTIWRIAETPYTSKSVVNRIDIEVIKKEVKINYFPWGNSGNFFKEEDCFASIEEAQTECDNRNKEVKQ
jgi:RNA polymerase subunit RPABC4/transcription elongation factor Spt4